MTRADVSILAFKILSITTFLYGLSFLPHFLKAIFSASGGYSNFLVFANVLSFIVPILFGFALWFFASKLTQRIFPESQLISNNISATEFQSVAFSVVGLTLLVFSIEDFVWAVAYISDFGPNTPTSQKIAGSTIFTLKLAIGIWLLLGSTGIVGFIRKLRD